MRTARVVGDGQTYDQACTAGGDQHGLQDGRRLPPDMGLLMRQASRVACGVRGIDRVTCGITSRPPGTIEWE